MSLMLCDSDQCVHVSVWLLAKRVHKNVLALNPKPETLNPKGAGKARAQERGDGQAHMQVSTGVGAGMG